MRRVFLLLAMMTISVMAQDRRPPVPTSNAAADRPTMGILDAHFIGQKDDPVLRDLFTTAVRGRVVKLVSDSVDVIEGSKLDRLIQVNASSCSNASCLAQFAKKAGLDYLLETKLTFHKGKWTASLKLACAKDESVRDEETQTFANEDAAQAGISTLAEAVVKNLVKSVSEGQEGRELNISSHQLEAVPDEVGTIVTFSFKDGAGDVSVSGAGKCKGDVDCPLELSKGRHTVTMRREGYRDSVFAITVPKGENHYVVALRVKTGILTLRSQDESGKAIHAEIWVDGVQRGATPKSLVLPLIAREIVLKADGYDDVVVAERPAGEGAKASAKVILKPANQLRDSRDGQSYPIVTIGAQTWMAKNLNYLTGASSCAKDDEDCQKYGRLYDWYTAQKACPDGWHLPNDQEWAQLESFASPNPGQKLKAAAWNGNDAYGFNAVPTIGGDFAFFWSSSENDAVYGWNRALYIGHSDFRHIDDKKSAMYSARCLKGLEKKERPKQKTKASKPQTKGHFTDHRDGKSYRTVHIGKQTWMAENLNYGTSNSWCYDNDVANCQKYGRLYDWQTAKTACPDGWHLPNEQEWVVLANFLGKDSAGDKLKSSTDWNSKDPVGFDAIPGGIYIPGGKKPFVWIGESANFWSATERETDPKSARYRSIDRYRFISDDNFAYVSKTEGFSVRCVSP